MKQFIWVVVGVVAGLLVAGTVATGGGMSPAEGFALHLDADHTDYVAGKAVPIHHFCKQTTPNVIMCLAFTSDEPNAKLVGVEPIITTAQWKTLSAGERRKWHYHRPEIEGGFVKLIGVPAEQAAKIAEFAKETYGQMIYFWRADSSVPTKPAFGAYGRR